MSLEKLLHSAKEIGCAIALAGTLVFPIEGCNNPSNMQQSQSETYQKAALSIKKRPEELKEIADKEAEKYLENPELALVTVGEFSLYKNDRGELYYKVPGWSFCYFNKNNKNKNIIIKVNENKSVFINPKDTKISPEIFLELAPLQNWIVYVDEAVEIANQYGATRQRGYFELKMDKIDNENIPIWTLPFEVEKGKLIKINALDGNLIGLTNLAEPSIKTVGSGILKDDKLEVKAKSLETESSFNPMMGSPFFSAASYEEIAHYKLKNISGRELTIGIIQSYLFSDLDEYLQVVTLRKDSENYQQLYLDKEEVFEPPFEKGIDEKGRAYFKGLPLDVLANGETMDLRLSTAYRHFSGGINKIRISIHYMNGDHSLFTDYLTELKKEESQRRFKPK